MWDKLNLDSHIWCKYIGCHTEYLRNQNHFFVFRDIKTNFWEKLNLQIFRYWFEKNFFLENFLCASTWNDPKILAKFSDLLFFVVATKFFCRFFLYYHVGAHLKNFLRARAVTPVKKCLNIKQWLDFQQNI